MQESTSPACDFSTDKTPLLVKKAISWAFLVSRPRITSFEVPLVAEFIPFVPESIPLVPRYLKFWKRFCMMTSVLQIEVIDAR